MTLPETRPPSGFCGKYPMCHAIKSPQPGSMELTRLSRAVESFDSELWVTEPEPTFIAIAQLYFLFPVKTLGNWDALKVLNALRY